LCAARSSDLAEDTSNELSSKVVMISVRATEAATWIVAMAAPPLILVPISKTVCRVSA
jgi:hypothetical protein